jgi:hypothetical protein
LYITVDVPDVLYHVGSDNIPPSEEVNFKPEKGAGGFFRVWSIAKDVTAKMVQQAFEKIIKVPFNLIFKRKYKTRDKGGEREHRWWIEVKGDAEELKKLSSKQGEIESHLACRLEAKAS